MNNKIKSMGGDLGSKFIPVNLIAKKSLSHCSLVIGIDPDALQLPPPSVAGERISRQVAGDAEALGISARLGSRELDRYVQIESPKTVFRTSF